MQKDPPYLKRFKPALLYIVNILQSVLKNPKLSLLYFLSERPRVMLGGYSGGASYQATNVELAREQTEGDREQEDSRQQPSSQEAQDRGQDGEGEGGGRGSGQILHFDLVTESTQPIIREFVSNTTVAGDRLLLNLGVFFYGDFSTELRAFLRNEFRREQSRIRVWVTVNVEFSRDGENGVRTFTVCPFKLRPFYISVVDDIEDQVSSAISDLLNRIEKFLQSGSGWRVEALLQVSLVYVSNDEKFNMVGYSSARFRRRMFGNQEANHCSSDGSLIFHKSMFSLCSDSGLCFPLAIACSHVPFETLKGDIQRMTDEQVLVYKRGLLSLCYDKYDMTMFKSFPTSFLAIKEFARANSDKLLVNLVGVSRIKSKGRKPKKGSPTHKIWPVFQTEGFAKRSLADGSLHKVTLAVTSEVSLESAPNRYHVSLVPDFETLIRSVRTDYGRYRGRFCPSCFGRFPVVRFSTHVENCHSSNSSESQTEIEFLPVGSQTVFRMNQSASISPIVSGFDIEVGHRPVADSKMLGQMADCRGELVPVSFASYFGYHLDSVDTLPKLLPKCYIGQDSIEKFYHTAMIELAYLQSELRQVYFPIDMTEDEKALRAEATSCANCARDFRDNEVKLSHHDHTKKHNNFLGYLCARCNGLELKVQAGVCFVQNLKSFESVFLSNSIVRPEVRRLLQELKIFTKGSGDAVSSMRCVFTCLLCDESLIPERRIAYRWFGQNKTQLEDDLDLEYERIKDVLKERKRADRARAENERLDQDSTADDEGSGDSSSGSETDSGESDDAVEEEEEGEGGGEERVKQSNKWKRGPLLNEAFPKCPHPKRERTLVLRDSMSYFAGSGLQRTVDAVRACFQPERCGDFSSGFLVSEERRHCVCCRDLYSFKQEGSILCDFAVNGFNDIKAVDSLCKKAIFPYSKLTSLVMKDGTINESVLVEPMPEFSAFENQLADPRSEKGQPSLQDYRELMQLTEAWGLTNFQDLLIVYNICDVALMLLCVFTVNRFYFKSFGLSIMRYSSLSRFAYDCLLKGVYDKYGRGVETISSMEMLRFLEGGTFGGMSSVLFHGGTPKYANLRELPNFDPNKPQILILDPDLNGMYPGGMLRKLPMHHYRQHDEHSLLVKQMNHRLQTTSQDAFIAYYQQEAERFSRCFLIRVRISYPFDIHYDMADLVPTCSRRKVPLESLSPAQQEFVKILSTKPCTKEDVLVQDLLPQTTTVHLSYLALLVRLRVRVDAVEGCLTAYQTDFFREPMEKSLRLKATATSPMMRQLSKNWGNSGVGMTLLKKQNYPDQRLVVGARALINAVTSPRLQRFRLLAPDAMIASMSKRLIKHDTLTFVGCCIMSYSKEFLLSQWYETMKPRIQAGLGVFPALDCSVLYVDTDCATICIEAPSFASCRTELRSVDLYFAFRDILDFGPHLKQPNHVVWSAFKERLPAAEFDAFVAWARGRTGKELLWKFEHDVGSHSDGIVLFYTIRTKVYISIAHVQNHDSPPISKVKKIMKGPILKSRAGNMTLEDYLTMGDANCSPVLQRDMRKLQGRHWKMYFSALDRYQPTIFDRKRWLACKYSGISVPFGYLSSSGPDDPATV